MKKNIIFNGVLTLSFLLLILFSCNKDDKNEVTNLEADEAAELAGASLSSDKGGSLSQFTDAIVLSEEIYEDEKSIKEEIFDTTFTITNLSGAFFTFEYQFHYEYGIRYNTQEGAFEFYMNFDTDGYYESPKVYSEDNSEGNIILSGLEAVYDNCSISGSVTRNGSQTTNFREEKSIKSTITLNYTDILIRKSDLKILSGSGNIEIYGETIKGQKFSFYGTLEYTADETIILTINENVYIINLYSGEIE